jgi:hypothetical protein
MTDERTDPGIHTGEQALRFSKCITKQHARAAFLRIRFSTRR